MSPLQSGPYPSKAATGGAGRHDTLGSEFPQQRDPNAPAGAHWRTWETECSVQSPPWTTTGTPSFRRRVYRGWLSALAAKLNMCKSRKV